MGRMYNPTLYAQRIKGIIIHLRKTVYINVYLHVNLTLLKVKTENKYNQSLLSHANSFSISSVSIFQNFIIQLFPTTNLWVHFVKLSTEHVSNISLATPKWFQDKIQNKWVFQSQKITKILTESNDMIETTWMSESSILLLLETESICELFLWDPHVITFLIFSWHFDFENL